MAAKIIDGKRFQPRSAASDPGVVKLKPRGVTPGLAVVLVGEDPASKVYVGRRRRPASSSAALAQYALPATTSEAELLAPIEKLNTTPDRRLLVQLPREAIDGNKLIARSTRTRTSTASTWNVGRLVIGTEGFKP